MLAKVCSCEHSLDVDMARGNQTTDHADGLGRSEKDGVDDEVRSENRLPRSFG